MKTEIKCYYYRPRQRILETEKRLIKATVGNRFFTVHFETRDGAIRKLNGRLGVTKHIKNIDDFKTATSLYSSKYMVVYDVKNCGYRNVNVDTISLIVVNGTEHHYISAV